MNLRAILRITSLLVLSTLLVPYAAAQFSGPSHTTDENVNLPVQITTDPAILFPPQQEIRLAPGDTVSVHLYGETDYAPQDKVSLDGYIRLPLISPVQVEGLTTHEAEHLIATRLEAAGMYHNPQVILIVTESPSHIVTLTGEMHGVVPVLSPKRLYDVLSAGGGLPSSASSVVTILRPGAEKPIVVDLGNDPAHSQMANIPVFSGDTIVVGRTGAAYVVGAVKQQGVVSLSKTTPLTLMQAMASTGGPTFEAKTKDIKIIRTIGKQRSAINVNFQRVKDGQAPDPILLADDIVLVPSSAIRAAIKSGGISTVLSVASLLVAIAINR